jgi:hypothetical protein
MKRKRKEDINWVGWLALLVVALVAAQAGAQLTTASLRGTVNDATGPIPGATVTVTNTASGFEYSSVTDAQGVFNFSGLTPGSYELRINLEGYQEAAQVVKLLIGQTLTTKIELKQKQVFIGGVTVVGDKTKILIDTRTPTVTTNITQEQIETLPMNNRNFLAFAGLAPGIEFTQNTDGDQYFGSAGAKPEQVNVYIDGLSYKNNLLKGGAFMQDSSKGNPFPENAVQEYQVMTQNYKAEYEQAAAAVITAVTKSGGNDFHGDAFFYFQNKDMIARDEFTPPPKPPLTRKQFGLSLGGPIIKDKLNFFVSYEGNERDVEANISRGGNWNQAPANVTSILENYPVGAVSAPFNSNLYFGKLSWHPSMAQTLDLSYNKRVESNTTGFGGQTEKSAASKFENYTDSAVLHHLWVITSNTLNEANLNYQTMEWIQGTPASSEPNLNYIGLLQVGGATFRQDYKQSKTGLRDDFSYLVDWHGSHTFKAGFVANFFKYDVTHAAYFNPEFDFSADQNWQYPFQAHFGFGNPVNRYTNNQYGVYVQDDWKVASNLTINAGIRWDYETNGLNNSWVTPASLVSALQSSCRTYDQPIGGQTTWCIPQIFNINDYVSNGHNRKSYTGEYQPRLGFSWDVNGNGKTVVIGGWGLYYDRVPLNDIYDEEFKFTWGQYNFCFTDDPTKVGTFNPACSAVPMILWNPSYQSAAGLAGLIASGAASGHEVNLLANDTHVPRSVQWNLGVRQQFGDWLASLIYSNVRGYNGLVWSFGTLPPGTPFNDRWGDSVPVQGYGFTMRSYDTRKSWYDGVFLTLDKPYTADSKWGFDMSYTYADAKQQASTDDGVAFAFDSLPPNFATFENIYTEKNKFIASGTVGLGAGFTVAGILTLSSGLPFYYTDCTNGYDQCFNAAKDPPKQVFLGIKAFAYRSLDLRVEWDTHVKGFDIGLIGEAFNVFNFANDSCFDGWTGGPGSLNDHFGKPYCQINTRRFQVGAKVGF